MIHIICKDNLNNSIYFWKNFKEHLFKYLQYPCVSLLMFTSDLVKNHEFILKDTENVENILKNLFNDKILNHCKEQKNVVSTYFILKTMENLVLFKNKIIFKNQVVQSKYLKTLSNLNQSITEFLTAPNIIKWEFHEIDQLS